MRAVGHGGEALLGKSAPSAGNLIEAVEAAPARAGVTLATSLKTHSSGRSGHLAPPAPPDTLRASPPFAATLLETAIQCRMSEIRGT